MAAENIKIDLFDDYYEIDITFLTYHRLIFDSGLFSDTISKSTRLPFIDVWKLLILVIVPVPYEYSGKPTFNSTVSPVLKNLNVISIS
jgi:hypothetical protein